MVVAIPVTLNGPYNLDRGTIDRMVTRTSPGVYVLSRSLSQNTAHYVGRSDSGLRGRLRDYHGTVYRHFWYAYAGSAREAFIDECLLYHHFGGSTSLDNKIHPRRPDNCNWLCPKCSQH